MVEAEEARKTRPAFYVAFGVAAAASAVWWWANRPHVPEFAEVMGVVTLDGRPLDRVQLKFLPDPAEGTRGPVSTCFTEADGRYTIRCDRYDRDGAVPGRHRVVFFDSTVFDTEGTGSKESRFPPRYEHLSSTPFVGVEVRPGPQELNFELASKK